MTNHEIEESEFDCVDLLPGHNAEVLEWVESGHVGSAADSRRPMVELQLAVVFEFLRLLLGTQHLQILHCVHRRTPLLRVLKEMEALHF